jgi:hypothetical protein
MAVVVLGPLKELPILFRSIIHVKAAPSPKDTKESVKLAWISGAIVKVTV